MIQGFDVKDQALGTGDTLAYTFDFKIFDPSDILIWVQDGSGKIVQKVRGDDNVFLAGVTYDSLDGGGTVTLAAFLPDTYTMTMMLAPDAPDQPTAFPNKSSLTFDILEGALDFIATQIQRVAYLAQRAVVLHDLDDITAFDPTLPLGIGNNPGGIISVKADGSGFESIISIGTIAAAQGYASTAISARDAAALSATAAAASAVAAAASAAGAQSGVLPYGSEGAPLNITTAGLTNHGGQEEAHFVQGSGGNVVISANPQISPGAAIGARMYIIGENDGQTLTLINGNGLSLNGDCKLGGADCLGLLWTGTQWTEMFRRSAT